MLHGFDLLRQQYKKYSAQSGRAQTPSSTITVLSERLSDPATQHEDRRAAILSLKSLVRDHADQVSEHALLPLLRWIKSRERDEEMLRAAVECCLALCQAHPDDPRTTARASKNMSRLLEEKDALLTLLTLLSPEHGFYTRFGALQLLVVLVENRRLEVQEYVLTAPGGCSSVLQCLEAAPSSSTEIIRNEALLLLPQLLRDNPDIQKITAFEGAFERLLDIMAQEGRIEGGVVVHDALEGLETLLLQNVSNQNYFRETLSIPLLAPLLFYPPPLPAHAPDHAQQEHLTHKQAFLLQEWDEQKLANAQLLLRCVRHLIDGQGEGHRSNQLVMCKTGLAEALVQLAMASLAPLPLKADALHVLASLLRGSRAAQDLISAMVITPVVLKEHSVPAAEGLQPPMELAWQSPHPAMLRLVEMALRVPIQPTDSPRVALRVRCAALQAVEALVEQNMDVRMTMWHAFVAAPTPDQSEQDGASLLLSSIAHLPNTTLAPTSKAPRFDPYQYLFAMTILSYILHGSETSKEFARRVCLNAEGRCVADASVPSSDDDEPATLVHVVVGNLAMALREQSEVVRRERAAQDLNGNPSGDWTKLIVGYLSLLSVWLWQSPASISDLLSESANLQVLIQPAAQTTGVDPLIQGLSAFVLGTAYEFNTLQSSTSNGSTAPTADEQEGLLTRQAMHPILHSRIGADQFSMRIQAVKNDKRFSSCSPETLELVGRSSGEKPASPGPADIMEEDIWFTWPFVEFWKDNYVRIQKSILNEPQATTAADTEASAELLDARQRLMTMEAQLARAQAEAGIVDKLRADLAQANETAELAKKEHAAAHEACDAAQKELHAAHHAHEARENEWNAEREARHAECTHWREACEATKAQLVSACSDLDELREQLAKGMREAPSEDAVSLRALEASRQETAAAQAHATHLERTVREQEQRLQNLNGRIAELEQAVSSDSYDELKKDYARIESENEDLLVLLDEITQKRVRDKNEMRAAGWTVSDSEDDNLDE